MTPVTLRVKGIHLTGRIKALTVLEDYPSDATHPQVVQLAVVCCDPTAVCKLMEAVGEDCNTRAHNVSDVPAVGVRVDARATRGSGQDVIEQVRLWLAEPGARLVDLPTEYIGVLLRECDTWRARAEIAEWRNGES